MTIHCPILEQTADGVCVGRCWFNLDGHICPRHGDVQKAVDKFERGDGLMLESDHDPQLKKAIERNRRTS